MHARAGFLIRLIMARDRAGQSYNSWYINKARETFLMTHESRRFVPLFTVV